MSIPTVNLNLIPTFPAKVVGSGPVTVTKAGLIYTFGWDVTRYSVNPMPDPAQVALVGFNGSTGATERYELSAIQSGFSITASQISDATTTGRSILTGDAAAGRTALVLGPLATLNAGSGLVAASGSLNLQTSGALAGSYTNITATVDQYGRITTVSSGSTAGGALGQCRLVKSGSNIVLQPFNGNGLTINGVNQTIPSAGVSLAPTGLTVGTVYYVYAYMNSGTMTLEASTTGHATSSTNGVETKSGDATRTLVGMVRPITGPAFADTQAQRFVISWQNRRNLSGSAAFTANRSISTGANYVEANSELRNEFLSWGEDAVSATFTGSWQSNSGTAVNYAGIAFDQTLNITGGAIQCSTNLSIPASLSASMPPAEGYHYATVVGKVSAGTVLFTGGADGSFLQTVTRG